jgi:hypothetical protein
MLGSTIHEAIDQGAAMFDTSLFHAVLAGGIANVVRFCAGLYLGAILERRRARPSARPFLPLNLLERLQEHVARLESLEQETRRFGAQLTMYSHDDRSALLEHAADLVCAVEALRRELEVTDRWLKNRSAGARPEACFAGEYPSASSASSRGGFPRPWTSCPPTPDLSAPSPL